MKLADIAPPKRPDKLGSTLKYYIKAEPEKFFEQMCLKYGLEYYNPSMSFDKKWYYLLSKNDNDEFITIVTKLFANWSDVIRYLQWLFNKDNNIRISVAETERFNVSLFFRYFDHLKALGLYLIHDEGYKLYDPLDIFSFIKKAIPAPKFFDLVLSRADPSVASDLYTSIEQSPISTHRFIDKIFSFDIWSSLKGQPTMLKPTWYEITERFDLHGKPIELPWQQTENWLKLGNNTQLAKELQRNGFSILNLLKEMPDNQAITAALIILEQLNMYNSIIVVSSKFELLLQAENIIGPVFTLTTRKNSSLVSPDQINLWKRMLPSDSDVLLDQVDSPLDYPFTSGLTIFSSMESNYLYEPDLNLLTRIILNRVKFKKPMIFLYGRSSTNRLTDIILHKEIAKKYPPTIAETIIYKTPIILLEPMRIA